MIVTSFYAAPLALMFVALSVLVIKRRRKAGAALGDGGDDSLRRAIRAHGNFSEYVPLALILMAFSEVNGAPAWSVHMLGVALVAGRLAHAYGVTQPAENFRFRVAGMSLTFTVLCGGAAVAVLSGLGAV